MLSHIELHSFKCFELLRLPLAPLTLLTGFNASGKSSVLQALALVHQTMSEHEWSTRLMLNGSSVRLGTVAEVVGRRDYKTAIESEEHRLYWAFAGERSEMSLAVQQVGIDDRSWDSPKELRYLLPPGHLGRAEDLGQDVGATALESLTNSLRRLTYITADRVAPQEMHPLEDPHQFKTVGSRGENTVSLLYRGRDEPVLEKLILPDIPPLRLRQVEGRMRELFPGFELELQPAAQRSNTVYLGMRTSNSMNFHSPVHTGFGLTQVLPIIVAALSAHEGDILLVENPEVHLHPAGQALMGQFLAKVAYAGVQVLVETHSDHVVNGVRRSVKDSKIVPEQVAIHFFRPQSENASQVMSLVLDEAGNVDDWPEGFFDQFDKDANYFAGWFED